MEGTVTRVDNGYVITFERRLRHPVDKVWAALTESSRLGDWLGGEASHIELRLGGRVYLAGHGRSGIESTVVALDPPHLIEYGWRTEEWEGGTIRWEVSEDGDASVLRLTHRMPEIDPVADRELMRRMGLDPDAFPPLPRNLAGWHTILDQLEAALDGTGKLPEDHWKSVFDRYAALT